MPHEVERASTSEGLPIAPSMGALLDAAQVTGHAALLDRHSVALAGIAAAVGLAAAAAAQLLTRTIGLATNLAFYGRWSTAFVSPAGNALGAWVVLVPAAGGLAVGLLARYGSRAIRGHGIPEAMEQVLTNASRIPARMTFLKPLSAAIAIGTGGPFGAEGPIIATGGALGSLVGQLLSTTAQERKTLLAAGAAAGMAATFGSPVSAVLLAIELLLFEYRPRSLVPVALAAAVATGARIAWSGAGPVFPMPAVAAPGSGALAAYVALGALVGVASVLVTRLVYAIEDAFDRLPLHWMWWPALGGLVVGAVGLLEPHTLGVGYDNIERLVDGTLVGRALALLCVLKLASWAVSLGSGTSGGTLAPLFTIGGGLGALAVAGAASLAPGLGLDARVGALVGMAAMFAGAARAPLASVVFAFETTRQPLGLLPLLGGCTAAYLVSCLMMQHSIMTEKIARRGVRVVSEYTVDFLDRLSAGAASQRDVVALRASAVLGEVRRWLASGAPGSGHQGFPVLDDAGRVVGVLTRRDLVEPGAREEAALGSLVRRPPVCVREHASLRAAADAMARERVGRVLVCSAAEPERLVGILTRSDLVAAHVGRLDELHRRDRTLRLAGLRRSR